MTSESGELHVKLRSVLHRMAVGHNVPSGDIADAFKMVCSLSAPTRDVLLGSLLAAVVTRGPIADEIEALIGSALTVDGVTDSVAVSNDRHPVLLVAGSGKKGIRTLNISTPATLVASAVGAKVIKVGSAATSSALGSRDLVHALGLPERRTAMDVQADLNSYGFAFVAVEPEIPTIDHLYGGRFHAPNPFSFGLAPLASPVRGDVTVFGLSHPRVDVAAEVLRRFGIDQVEALSTRLPSGHHVDEIGTVGEVHRCRVRDGVLGPVEVEATKDGTSIGAHVAEFPAPGNPAEMSARTIELLAGGGSDDHRALVAVNSAFLLMRAGLARSLVEARAVAEDALRSGVALNKLPTTPRQSALTHDQGSSPNSMLRDQ